MHFYLNSGVDCFLLRTVGDLLIIVSIFQFIHVSGVLLWTVKSTGGSSIANKSAIPGRGIRDTGLKQCSARPLSSLPLVAPILHNSLLSSIINTTTQKS